MNNCMTEQDSALETKSRLVSMGNEAHSVPSVAVINPSNLLLREVVDLSFQNAVKSMLPTLPAKNH